jgi:hypothetical protein
MLMSSERLTPEDEGTTIFRNVVLLVDTTFNSRKLEYLFIYLSIYLFMVYLLTGGRDSSVGMAPGYGLDGPGIESGWERSLPHPSRPALGPPSVAYGEYRFPFPGVKRPGRCVDHPPHLAPRLNKE